MSGNVTIIILIACLRKLLHCMLNLPLKAVWDSILIVVLFSVFGSIFSFFAHLLCLFLCAQLIAVASVNTHFRCFVIFSVPHLYRYVCHSLCCHRVSVDSGKGRWKKRRQPALSTHLFIFLVAWCDIFPTFSSFRLYLSLSPSLALFTIDACPFLAGLSALYHSLSLSREWNKKTTIRPSEKCEPINSVFSSLCIRYSIFFCLWVCVSVTLVLASSLLFSFWLSRNIELGCVPRECVSKMLFILGNMLAQAMHRSSVRNNILCDCHCCCCYFKCAPLERGDTKGVELVKWASEMDTKQKHTKKTSQKKIMKRNENTDTQWENQLKCIRNL